jgi:hypothetical protein
MVFERDGHTARVEIECDQSVDANELLYTAVDTLRKVTNTPQPF